MVSMERRISDKIWSDIQGTCPMPFPVDWLKYLGENDNQIKHG